MNNKQEQEFNAMLLEEEERRQQAKIDEFIEKNAGIVLAGILASGNRYQSPEYEAIVQTQRLAIKLYKTSNHD